ncbi:hypothetical protein NCAS_0B04200 [Naumovozyma castellii]|uniref:RecA family profile 1 domain-containing protein n=1 Tax=Naumovozyma castellii TaxID=27288 RepID=G0VA20_NAUCA|nr:hypothetical protein NCAS_0B04200 [Naumovozyma castellii CBS 4309]CCC68504.1 hypothetical protein NCAS_0B04200 [Naumovozyma castellii CBS 4309]
MSWIPHLVAELGMSFGISLSQLIVDNPEPLLSGISELDESLNVGFQSRSIYEIYGPPGIGKTKFGIQLVNNGLSRNSGQDHVLWIETHRCIPWNLVKNEEEEEEEDKIKRFSKVRLNKFTQLLIFFQNLLKEERDPYQLIIIDGFSQTICDHIQILRNRGMDEKQIHNVKCNHLILLFTWMTKYTHSKRSTIILLDDCMNTSYQQLDLHSFEDDFEMVDDGSNFFVRSTMSNNNNNNNNGSTATSFSSSPPSASSRDRAFGGRGRRRNIQVLKSALVANSAMGAKDFKWEIFLKCRIGFFWNWKEETLRADNFSKTHRRQFDRCRLAIVFDPHDERAKTLSDSRERGRKRGIDQVDMQNKIIKFDYNTEEGVFESVNNASVPLLLSFKRPSAMTSTPTMESTSQCSSTVQHIPDDQATTAMEWEMDEIVHDSEEE